mmetsp:Transcript_16000/g.24944  ORF Transcript_16000/g.24944 Transcript_16000/m.24944 type:complete len:124 (-) Transcript_16000:771-1142(-)
MSTRRSARIKKVSICCNGDVGSVSPDLSEGEETISVAGVVAVFSNEMEDAEEEDAEEDDAEEEDVEEDGDNDGDENGDGEHSVSSDELEQILVERKDTRAHTKTLQRRNCSGAGMMKNRRLRI